MKTTNLKSVFRIILITLLSCVLSGCVYWLRAYQTYLQMNEFDQHFYTQTTDNFTLHFKDPILFSDDFISLSNLYPTEEKSTVTGKAWKYFFRKVDMNKQLVKPEINFYSEIDFDKEGKIIDWSFSSLFLQIAPPQFLEASLRSIGGASIDTEKKQLRANTALLEKIQADLPKKDTVITHLGPPLDITDDQELEVYRYQFLLDTPHVDEGYEDNALNEIKISFDKKNQKLSKMSGNFAGLNVSIEYRDFVTASK